MKRITAVGLVATIALLVGACTDSKDNTSTTTPADSSDCSNIRGSGGVHLC